MVCSEEDFGAKCSDTPICSDTSICCLFRHSSQFNFKLLSFIQFIQEQFGICLITLIYQLISYPALPMTKSNWIFRKTSFRGTNLQLLKLCENGLFRNKIFVPNENFLVQNDIYKKKILHQNSEQNSSFLVRKRCQKGQKQDF